MQRTVPFESVIRGLTPFLVTRQIITGAGKIGIENEEKSTDHLFQISQRADFFSVLVSIDTMNRRPIINTRDEPHANSDRYRRLHVIVGDSNMSEIAGALKLGITSILLDLLEDGACPMHLDLADPIADLKNISRDPTLKTVVTLANGKTILPIDLQREYLVAAKTYLQNRDEETVWVLQTWEKILDDLECDPISCRDRVDWVAKKWLLDTFASTEGVTLDHPWLQSLDLEYHNVRQDEGLYAELVATDQMQTLVTEKQIRNAIHHPPRDTRAYFRGRCIEKFAKEMTSVQWDEVAFGHEGKEYVVRMLNAFDNTDVQRYNHAIDNASNVETLLRSLEIIAR